MPLETRLARYAAEFAGTFVLVFTVGCNVILGQTVFGGFSIASVLTVMIYSLAKSSGANFNPAVSVALGLVKKAGWFEVGIYVAVQLVAGVLGGLCYLFMFGKSFNLQPAQGHSWWQAGLAETLYTFMLCFVVLNTAASKANGNNQYFGLAIGFVIVAGAYSGGSISMGCFNPAVAFGIDLSSMHAGVWYCFVYTFFELLGAGMAASLFIACRREEMVAHMVPPNKKVPAEVPPLQSRALSEFIGTYMLVLTVGLNVLSGSPAAAFSIAACLMSMIFALGSCSGAHFNPAVTVAILCTGHKKELTPNTALVYVCAQLAGGVTAAFTYVLLMNGKGFLLYSGNFSWSQVALAEFVFTTILAFVVLSVATVKEPLSEFFGLAIGMCVTVGGFAIGKVSGGSLNPAVSVGISAGSVVGGGIFWHCIVYSVVELAAGAFAAALFRRSSKRRLGSQCRVVKLDAVEMPLV